MSAYQECKKLCPMGCIFLHCERHVLGGQLSDSSRETGGKYEKLQPSFDEIGYFRGFENYLEAFIDP